MSMQLVTRARRAGFMVTPRDVFVRKTPAALAAAAGGPAPDCPQDAGTGELPLTPVMCWLAEHVGLTGRVCQSMVLNVPAGLGLEALTTAVQALLDHHDMLRARLGESGLVVLRPGEVRAAVRRVDAADDLDRAAAEQAGGAVARLDPGAGVMTDVVWLDAGPGRPGRLLIVIHHLVVDGVSWRVLIPDLEAAWRAASAGRPVELEPVGTSFRRWARLLAGRAGEPGQVTELDAWERLLGGGDPPLGERPLDPGRDVAANLRSVTVRLPAGQTAPLLTSVPAAFHGGVNDVLLAGLAVAVAQWRGHGGGVLVDVEGHGREQIAGDVDVSRTVGWFTNVVPVRLDPGVEDFPGVRDGGPAAGEAVKRVKEQLRAIPGDGLGYGLLRYLNPGTAPVLAALPAPQIGFNYLGRFTAGPDGADWAPAGETVLGAAGEDIPVTHALEILAYVRDLPDGPEMTISLYWPEGIISDQAARDLAGTWLTMLDGLTAHTAQPGSGGAFATVLPIRPEGTRPPLFCIHPLAGLSWCYRGLADLLPPDWPVYGLQARGLTAGAPPPRHRGEDGRRLPRRDQGDPAHRPVSPARLVLRRPGRERHRHPPPRRRRTGRAAGDARRLPAGGEDTRATDPHARIRSILEALGFDPEAAGGVRDLDGVVGLCRRTGGPLNNLEETELAAVLGVWANNLKLAATFTPSRFDGHILFFSAACDHAESDARVWETLTRASVDVHRIGCRHGQLTQPQPLAEIAEIITRKVN